jgi:NAD(P)-dependent dehydrogenase (short-subunit alcohol dehydrogenase family)
MNLSNKVVVVTGGAGLLGNEFCKKISDCGGIAIIADISLQKAKQAASNIDNSSFVEMDITSIDSIEHVIRVLSIKYGKIDALINNAYPRNRNYGRDFFDVEYKDFCDNLGMNLGGYFLTSQQFSKHFIKQGSGNIINISSIYGVIAPRFEVYSGTEMNMPVEYAAIKSGLIHLTKYMATFFKGKGIRVNTISPGGILDGQPGPFLEKYKDNCLNKGMLDKGDLAGTVAFLLSDESKFINGQNIIVDDGFTL